MHSSRQGTKQFNLGNHVCTKLLSSGRAVPCLRLAPSNLKRLPQAAAWLRIEAKPIPQPQQVPSGAETSGERVRYHCRRGLTQGAALGLWQSPAAALSPLGHHHRQFPRPPPMSALHWGGL